MDNKIIVPSSGLDQTNITDINAYIKNYTRKNEGFTLEIKPIRDLRSLQQNKLYWVFMEAISRKQGVVKQRADLDVKEAFMYATQKTDWPETSKMDVNEMNSILSFAFEYLMSEKIDGNLTNEEGTQWVNYLKSMENTNEKD